jgi:putative transposase
MTREIRPELLDELLSGYEKPADLLGEDGIFQQLRKRLLERALDAELTDHLGYEKHQRSGRRGGNARNGHSAKTVLTDTGSLTLAIPRDREGSFEPAIVPKGVTRLEGINGQIISLYARGLSVRDVQAHLHQIYQVEVSPELISRVTNAVLEDVLAWRSRPLEPVYPVVFLDALRVKIRHEGVVRNKAIYVALGLKMTGEKEVLGLWVEQTEGARFWLGVLNELKTRGLEDILIAVVDGLKGFPEAIEAVFPQTMTQTCIVHLIRNSLEPVSWKDRKALMPALKAIYQAPTEQAAEAALDAFEAGSWAKRYPMIAPAWRRAWVYVVPFFAFPPAIRKMIYTTNAVESLNRTLRKVIKTRGSFPSDEAALKLLYLAIQHAELRWKPAIAWPEARLQFLILFAHRIGQSAS